MRYLIRNPYKRRIVSLLDKVGTVFFARRSRDPSNIVRKVLLIRLDHLGDVLLTTPAIKTLKKQFPDARLTMLVKEWSYETIRNNPTIDKIIVFNSFWTIPREEGNKSVGVTGIVRLIRHLRREHFDLAIDFKGDFRNILIAYLAGTRRRISYAVRGGGFLLTDIVPYEPGIHEIDKNLKLLSPLGVNSQESNMELHVDDKDIAAVESIFAKKGIDSKRRIIALHPGGGSEYKCWGGEKFITIAEKLTKDSFTNVLIFAGHYERKSFQVEGKSARGIFVMPNLSVCQMAAAFKKCDLLVCNDSGPMHIGFAVGTPTVAIFGPTFPNRFGPKDLRKNRVVRLQLPCSPCWHPDKGLGCRERNCLKGIEIDEVLTAINELERKSTSIKKLAV